MTLRHSACAAALLLVLSSQGVSAQPAKAAGQCFFTGQFQNWRAPEPRTKTLETPKGQVPLPDWLPPSVVEGWRPEPRGSIPLGSSLWRLALPPAPAPPGGAGDAVTRSVSR